MAHTCTRTHTHTHHHCCPALLVSNLNILHRVYKAKVLLPCFTSARIIPGSDKKENKKPAEDIERGCHGDTGMSAVQNVWGPQTGRASIVSMCAVWSQLLVLLPLSPPGPQPFFAAGLSLSQQESWHHAMVSQHSSSSPHAIVCLLEFNHASKV